jgi:ketol-acid reductoisomerase
LTQSLIRLVSQNGMDWMYANCSTTAQRGALDWRHEFRKATEPVFEKLYQSVVSGEDPHCDQSQQCSGLQTKTQYELSEMRESEMWAAGATVRSLRPENWGKENVH